MIKRIDFTVDNISDIVAKLSQEDLINFLKEYDSYVQDSYVNLDEGSTPVCTVEFFNNAYPLILEEDYDDLAFIDDVEKMIDFLSITKEEFLQQYSYLSEEEYDVTKDKFDKDKVEVLADLYRQAENIYLEEINDRSTGLSITSDEMKTVLTAYVIDNLTQAEREELSDLCNDMGC